MTSDYKKELNIKITGLGIGGCDVIMNLGDVDTGDCWCQWGVLNYAFCAYTKTGIEAKDSLNGTVTIIDESEFEVSNVTETGRCPAKTGETLVCNDIDSLGNCYKGAYTCNVDASGFCHCEAV